MLKILKVKARIGQGLVVLVSSLGDESRIRVSKPARSVVGVVGQAGQRDLVLIGQAEPGP